MVKRIQLLPEKHRIFNGFIILLAAVLLSACTTGRVSCVVPKSAGETLESYGQTRAAEYNVFCNMMNDNGTPAAVLNFFDKLKNKPCIVQSYIYDCGTYFKEIKRIFHTRTISPQGSSLSICLPRQYRTSLSKDTPFSYELVCTSSNTNMPPLKIRRFSMNDFPAGYIVETDGLAETSSELIASLSEDGWTREELSALYGSSFRFTKKDIVRRNDCDIAFLGYLDRDILKVRVFIEDNDSYIMLCTEAEISKFQHIASALVDSISW